MGRKEPYAMKISRFTEEIADYRGDSGLRSVTGDVRKKSFD
jgi:hypothetical protein